MFRANLNEIDVQTHTIARIGIIFDMLCAATVCQRDSMKRKWHALATHWRDDVACHADPLVAMMTGSIDVFDNHDVRISVDK